MEATAKVIPWNGKTLPARDASLPAAERGETGSPVDRRFGPLEGFVIMIPDDQLEALGAIFAASPLRAAMTFEGYLVAKGFGQTLG